MLFFALKLISWGLLERFGYFYGTRLSVVRYLVDLDIGAVEE